MARTWGDFVNWVRTDFPSVGDREAQQALSEAYRNLLAEGQWPFLIKESVITTNPSYSTGTVAVASGSPTLTGTGTSWNTGWTYRKILLGGVVYKIASFASTTSATLESAYHGADNLSGEDYVIYQDTYALPTDCDYGRELYLLNNAMSERLAGIDYRDLLLAKASAPGCLGVPTAFAKSMWSSTGASAAPAAMIELGPDAPSAQDGYTLVYLRKPPLPTNETHYPLWPEDFEDLLYLAAAKFIAENPSRPHAMRFEIDRRYAQRLFDLKTRMGGRANMDRYVKNRWPLLRHRTPYVNVRYAG